MFTMKHNARRSARSKLDPEAREGHEFELYEQDGQWGWRGLGEHAAQADLESKQVPVLTTASPVAALLAAVAAEPRLEPKMPTPFIPDFANGEIANSEYGLLLSRERAVAAAEAAGATNVVITQTARGMWCWRTRALNEVWLEANSPAPSTAAAKPPKAVREVSPNKPRPASQAGGGTPRTNPKITTAIGLLKRESGATTAEVAAATGWQEHSARARIMADVKGKLGHNVQATTEPGRGKVYRIPAAAPVAESA
jgi:hypothetical protein